MTDSDFRALVRRMRAAQKRYFAKRDNLEQCKELEHDVDEEAREQPCLFDDPLGRCAHCQGTGADPDVTATSLPCPECGGEGVRP